MNELQKELQMLKAKVAELESRILFPNEPVAKWQPKGGDWWIDSEGEVVEVDTSCGSKYFGTERQTKEQGERASIEMRRFNRLLALRDELCGDEFVDFSNTDPKYYIQYVHTSKKWNIPYNNYSEATVPYFSNLNAAQKACDMLNSGEVEL